MTEQLAFPFAVPPNPLLERFGREFFKGIPRAAGVYIMTNEAGRVLYVGQSGNLRARLAYYKNARPGRESRRILRLVRQARSLTWEICADALEAQVRENQLLRLHRPRFNVANTLSVTYPYVIWQFNPLSWRVSAESKTGRGEKAFGVFKSRTLVQQALAALSRLLWAIHFQPKSAFELPLQLLRLKLPAEFPLAFAPEPWSSLIQAFYQGETRELPARLRIELTSAPCPFMSLMQQSDLSTLEAFGARGPARHLELRKNLELGERLILREELDDLLVRQRHLKKNSLIGPCKPDTDRSIIPA